MNFSVNLYEILMKFGMQTTELEDEHVSTDFPCQVSGVTLTLPKYKAFRKSACRHWRLLQLTTPPGCVVVAAEIFGSHSATVIKV